MNNKLEMAQDKFTESVGKLAESFGLNKSIAQLYAVLYLSDKPLSLDELVERLGVSKGNISLNIRELESWGAVKDIWVKGSRKDYYEADPDIKKVFVNKMKSSIEKRISWVSGMLDEFKEMLDSVEGDLTPEEKKAVRAYKERLKKVENLKSLALKGLSIAEKFL
ncbi:MAG: MarR family transcriptional regulator [Candidatus Omnitrophota bacterium]